jgi:hypothetical protein
MTSSASPEISFGELEGSLNGVPSSDGKNWFLRHRRFSWDGTAQDESTAHLFAPNGFLDPSLHHRHYWIYGARYGAGVSAAAVTTQKAPYGRIMSLDERTVFAFCTTVHSFGRSSKNVAQVAQVGQAGLLRATPRDAAGRQGKPIWGVPSSVYVTAMALTPKVLFVAGRKGDIETSLEAFRGELGSGLEAVSPETGARLGEWKLVYPPVFDGLIAARGNVYLADIKGRLICWKSRR